MSGAVHFLRSALIAIGLFVLIVCAITLAGALCGAALFLAVGKLFAMDYGTGELLRNGFYDGGFLALIWAPGISFVALVIRSYRKRKNHGRDQANCLTANIRISKRNPTLN